MSADFTDEELYAYADESLSTQRSNEIEQSLRGDLALSARLAGLLSDRDQGEHSLGQLWRRDRLSCPSRSVWAAFLDDRLGDGMKRYLQFHLDTIGCRMCAANLADLSQSESELQREIRARKIFQSSAGALRPDRDV